MPDMAAVQLALRAPLVAWGSLPTLVAWENYVPTSDPVTGTPYLTEQFIPATATGISFPASGGSMEATGLYVLTWWGAVNTGLVAIRAATDAILGLYKAGTAFTIDASTVVRVRSDQGPQAGGIRTDVPGWAVVTITIPWRLTYLNT